MLWLFNIVGLLDLIYANIATFKDHVDPVQLGVSYYLAVINVPAMVVVQRDRPRPAGVTVAQLGAVFAVAAHAASLRSRR
jgi:hypothetical protein